MAGPDIDAELIAMTARFWKRLGIEDVTLQLNSLGSPPARTVYREQLVSYFETHWDILDEDSRRRLHTNPLRILDTKNPLMQDVVAGAPVLLEYLDADSKGHFEQLKRLLDTLAIPYIINPRLVRGLDYYGKTVFEWVTDRLGAQGTVCAGGRYDGLVEQLGGRASPAVGFAIGLERLIAMLAEVDDQGVNFSPHGYLVMVGETAQCQGLALAEKLRDRLPGLRIEVNCSGGGFKTQLKRADRSGARWALILGEEEAAAGRIAVKSLREAEQPQHELSQQAVEEFLVTQLSTLAHN